jgi:hypothetical protein
MVCPKLDSRDLLVPVCRLKKRAYVPGEEEVTEFCSTDKHRFCPLYLQDQQAYVDVCRAEVERVMG